MRVGKVVVAGDLSFASIMVVGGNHGKVDHVLIEGDILGGSQELSGVLSANQIKTLTVEGVLRGGTGKDSGLKSMSAAACGDLAVCESAMIHAIYLKSSDD